MAKKGYKMTKVEMFDTFIPIVCVCWVLVFSYISLFVKSGVLAMITVVPVFFLYGLYLLGSAIYCYKELEILKELGRDTYEIEKKFRKNPPKLSIAKIGVSAGCIIAGILLCVFL